MNSRDAVFSSTILINGSKGNESVIFQKDGAQHGRVYSYADYYRTTLAVDDPTGVIPSKCESRVEKSGKR